MLPGMIGRLGMLISHLFRWLIPDPFVIAILLSVVTVVAALLCLARLMRVARDHKIAKAKKDPRKKKKQTKVVEVTALGKTDEKV